MPSLSMLNDTQGYGSPLLNPITSPTLVSSLSSTTRSRKARPLTTTFSALPPLQSLVASLTANITTQTLETSSIPPIETLPPQIKDAEAHGGSQPHPVSLAIIVLLAVGAGFLLLGICIIIRMCIRPTRRPRPTPSLPMLKDLDPDDQFYESKESPIFGGKERLSPLQGANASGPMWTWVQPTQPTTQNTSTQNLTRQSFHPPTILTKASNRLSVTSMSLCSPQANIGLAKRKSQNGLEDKKNRHSTNSSIHLAYDAEVLSPVPTEYVQVRETPIINTSERRERVKSSYFAASTYPRVSTLPSGSYSIATATKVNVGHRISFGKDKIQYMPSSEIPSSGTLKKMEFRLSQMSLSVPALDGNENEEGRMRISEAEEGFGSRRNVPITLPLRTMDKAPRVPSPPPLPSLTQMGLAHNNPESYASYRSPTYSIYGFYENDRMNSFAK